MENKINIAELLKDCPKGMELDCTMYDNAYLEQIDEKAVYPIVINIGNTNTISLTKEGHWNKFPNAKCVIFPKGKTTWEGFHRPFKDGDIVTYEYENGLVSMILNKFVNFVEIHHHCALYDNAKGFVTNNYIVGEPKYTHFATEEEKQKLFDAIKANGYKWNIETKTLEKLPKFNIGNEIRIIDSDSLHVVTEIRENCYVLDYRNDLLPFSSQDEWELVPNKFDINTLKPYDKVLVRNSKGQSWTPAFFGRICRDNGYITSFGWCQYCIPFKYNVHLLGTTNDCDDFYKTWEK